MPGSLVRCGRWSMEALWRILVVRLVGTLAPDGAVPLDVDDTDLTKHQASAEHLLRLVRGHWGVESLHWIRDVTYDEDRSQVRTGTLPRVLATLRNLAISMIRHTTTRTTNIAAATRQLARNPDTILDLLGIPPRLCT